ncbi:hypothetical protein [Echinimonas agarilytica]|uniref:Uncharacterized protein n=1 Tax=Echinimonas agarilytica TaxID=1215918 RepID=A0AA42B864_9GAMM|nr:hypothetical protein [Echinimonas agarilytica]MCM2680048.1 hypothetical protein [Echinimonas agarilytica]
MTEPKTPVTDDQIDSAYQDALNQLEPNKLVEQRIRNTAHERVKKTSDWASFSMWARAASVVGVAVLGWWLWQPGLLELQQSEHAPLASTPFEDQPAAPEQLRSEARIVETERAEMQADALARREEIHAVAQSKMKSLARQPNTQGSAIAAQKSTLKQQYCLMSELGKVETLDANQAPQDFVRSELDSAPLLSWQRRTWKVVQRSERWYLVNDDSETLEWRVIPSATMLKCN